MWPNTITQLVCEIILHYNPLSCVAANILSQAQTTHPTLTVVNQIPSMNYIQECSSIFLCITKTMTMVEPEKYPLGKNSLMAQAVGKW